MWIRHVLAVAALVFAFFSLSPAGAVADGVYIPPVAYPAMPKIPVQRAMIVYRDGMETLVVESTMDTEALDVGWILPLPAEPTKLDVADGGMLTSMAFCLRPAITHDLHDLWLYAVLVLGFLAPIALFAICSEEGVSVFTVVCLSFIYILLLGVLIPAGAHLGEEGSVAATVLVRSTQRVGDYNVSVLRAGDAQGLSQWLTDNGLRALDENASAVVGDYIARGWCFAVARLARAKGGEATPHPIAATFPAERPVYPMKLTSLAGSTTRVELYVVADRTAGAEGFHEVLSGRFTPGKFRLDEDSPIYATVDPWLLIGNPDLCERMWDGCVVTRLEANLAPEAMDRDVAIELTEFRPHRDHYFSPRGRGQLAVAMLLWGAVPIALVAAIVFYKRRRPSRRGARVFLVIVAVTLVATGAAYLSAPVIAVGPNVKFMEGEMWAHYMGEVATLMVHQGNLHAGMTPAEISVAFEKGAEFLAEALLTEDGRIANPFTGEPMRYERSPGNFSTRTVGDKTYFCLYDKYAREIRAVELPPTPKPQRAGSESETK